MKRIFSLILFITITFIGNLSATNYIFSGNGNWSDVTKWTPSFPQNTPTQTYTSIEDTISINGNCTIQNTDYISINYSLTYLVNGTLINNGNLNFLGHFYISSTGDLTNNSSILGLVSVGADDVTWNNKIINNGSLINNNIILIDGIEQTFFENNGFFQNNNYLESVGVVRNNGKIISNNSTIYCSGRQFFNYDTIIGNIHSSSLANYGVLSPGLSEFDSDTFFCEIYGIANYGIINMDINSASDYDVFVLDYGNNISLISGMVINLKTNFTLTIYDTFTLVKILNEGSSPFKMARNNMTLPTPPIGFTWKVIYEPLAVKLTLTPSTALPYENLTFNAIQKANHVVLNWNVTSIENVANFDIERADDNNQFKKIGSVEGSEKLDYSFVDTKPTIGINQYRLKAIDIDGKYQYSYIVNVDFSTLKNEIINTLVENNLYININAEESIAIFNEVGQLVSNQIILDGQTTISLSHLTKGIYFVQTNNATYKILKL